MVGRVCKLLPIRLLRRAQREEGVAVGPHLIELGLPRVADDLPLVQSVEVVRKAPFLVRLLLERHLPHMADDSLKHSLRQCNAAEVTSVAKLGSTLGSRGGEGAVRN